MRISAQIDMRGAIEKLKTLPEKVRDKAITQTINETITRTQTEMKRQITGEFNIKAADVANSLRVKKASAKGALIEATLTALANGSSKTGARNIILFGAKFVPGNGPIKYVRAKMKDGSWRMVKTREGQGVRVKIKRSGGSVFIKGAWVANNLAGSPVLFRDKNNKVRGFTTIGVPSMFNTKRINEKVVAFAREQLIKSTQRTLDRFNR